MPTESQSNPTALQVGFGQVELPAQLGAPLAGVVTRHGRPCTHLRDPLAARALHLVLGSAQATILVADMLVATRALHRAVAREAGVEPSTLLLSATHTHSAPGGYWDLGRGELFMGAYQQATFDVLARRLAAATTLARRELSPARVLGGSATVAGANANRRRQHGPVDRQLQLVRFERTAGRPIDLVGFGAHPVIGAERDPGACSGDFPGELCGRLDARGHHGLFFQGPVGGVSPLFPEFPLPYDEHLHLLGNLLEQAVQRAEAELAPLRTGSLRAQAIQIPLPDVRCSVFPPAGLGYALAELASAPLRRYFVAMGHDARSSDTTELGLIQLGELALCGTPCDLGPTVAQAIGTSLQHAGASQVLVGSHCNDYVGYVHLPQDYARVPEPGFRQMCLYENAMSLSGHQLGQTFATAIEALVRSGGGPR